MNDTPNGGPAFPISRNHNSGDAIYTKGDGISARDWFAGQALSGLLHYVSRDDFNNGKFKHSAADVYADAAYATADAMLAARDAEKETR